MPSVPLTVDMQLNLLLRIIAAAVLGGCLGWERERRGEPAGLRTFMIVCVGAAVFCILSIYAFPGEASTSRFAAGVVVGIGFLGAGTIMQDRDHRPQKPIYGLTTAASLWTTSGIGAACGTGLLVLATGTTVLLLIILYVFRRIFEPASHRAQPSNHGQ